MDKEYREEGKIPAGTVRVGNHLYGTCTYCCRFIKLTGFFKGYHLCSPSEERAKIDAQRG